MFDFNKIYSEKVNRDFVLSKVSDGQIFWQYFGRFELGKVYPSRFRKDKNPSTGFYVGKTGKLMYNDLTTGERVDCFGFVSKLFNISYGEAIKKVATDFGIIGNNAAPVSSTPISDGWREIDKEIKQKTIIQFVPSRWTDDHLSFWREFEITKEELIKEKVYPIKDLYINKKKIYNWDNQIRFAYVEENEGNEYVKVYSPRDKKMKWVSNIPLHIPFGLNDLDDSDSTVIITKSKKDLLVLKKIFRNVIATQNESESALHEETIKRLEHFLRRIIFWDNDETGVENCKKFNQKGFGYFNIPKEYYNKFKIKDASDFVSYYGVSALEDLLREKNLL